MNTMPSQRVLVVVTDPVDQSALKRAVNDHVDHDAEVRIVSSPSLSFLEWVTNDEGDARVTACAKTPERLALCWACVPQCFFDASSHGGESIGSTVALAGRC